MKKFLTIAAVLCCISAVSMAQADQKSEESNPKVENAEVRSAEAVASDAENVKPETPSKKSCGTASAKSGCCASKKGKATASAETKACCAEAKKNGAGCDHAHKAENKQDHHE
jgi:hypothetical protein